MCVCKRRRVVENDDNDAGWSSWFFFFFFEAPLLFFFLWAKNGVHQVNLSRFSFELLKLHLKAVFFLYVFLPNLPSNEEWKKGVKNKTKKRKSYNRCRFAWVPLRDQSEAVFEFYFLFCCFGCSYEFEFELYECTSSSCCITTALNANVPKRLDSIGMYVCMYVGLSVCRIYIILHVWKIALKCKFSIQLMF